MRIFVHAPQSARSPNRQEANEAPAGADRSIVHLQRTIGNRAVQRLLHSGERGGGPAAAGTRPGLDSALPRRPAALRTAAGDQPEEGELELLGGESGGRQAGSHTGSAVMGGNASTMSTANLAGPQWNNNGEFRWWISWATDGTSGWIVQKIENTYSGTRADGSAITNASVGATPLYYEAWEVAANGTITGSLGATGNRDRWDRPNLGALGSQTSFSMTGTVYWTNSDPAASGFRSRAVRNAGSLLSSTSAPAGIGSPLLVRRAHGTWMRDGSTALPGCFTS